MKQQLLSTFCIGSNVSALIPTVLFYRAKNYIDGVFCCITATVSVLYHLNNNTPNFIDCFDEQSIRNVDVLISDMLVINIATYLVWGANTNNASYRYLVMLLYLPLETYSVSAGNVYRERLMGLAISVCLCSKLYRETVLNIYLWSGIMFSTIDVLCYRTLAPNSHTNYNLFHGLHHCTAFISIAFYIYAVQPQKEAVITRERSNSALVLEMGDFETTVSPPDSPTDPSAIQI